MIKIAIIGYGNLGKACESIAVHDDGFEIAGIFTRRNPSELTSPYGSKFFKQNDIYGFEGRVDVACICTGSANDVTALGVRLAKKFNTVDSFDTHAKMTDYFSDMSQAAEVSGHLSFIGIGWDPGLFSVMRAMFDAVLPDGVSHTFWGRGVSQGHSEAIRKIEGVIDAKQYTVPKTDALAIAREGGGEWLNDRDKHLRECYVAVRQDADKKRIESDIKNMPDYFEPYDTIVHFVSAKELAKNHAGMPHAGTVMRSGKANGRTQRLEFLLNLESNPDFTASVLMAYARANAYLWSCGERGARCAVDIPVSALFCGQNVIKRFV